MIFILSVSWENFIKQMLILLKSLKRPMGGRVALHPTSDYDQYDTGTPNRDAKYDDSDPQDLSQLDAE